MFHERSALVRLALSNRAPSARRVKESITRLRGNFAESAVPPYSTCVTANAPVTPSASEQAGENDAPVSERVPRATMSEMLWGLRWTEHLPLSICDGITVNASSFDRALPFVLGHYAEIFEEDGEGPFGRSRLGSNKERYYRLAGDFFEFKDGDKTVALFIGTPVDWSTYYIRSAAVLPEYQRRGLMLAFMPEFLRQLAAAGIERVEAETAPSNFATLTILTRLGFNVTGTTLSDRWGALLQLALFLDKSCEEVFLRQFCTGVRYQRRDRSVAPR